MRAWDGRGYQHVFGISHSYDTQGRRRFLHYPSMVGAGARVDYAYHPHTGALKTLTALGGHAFHFGYNGNGQLTELRSPAEITESNTYHPDGQRKQRHLTVNNDYAGTTEGLEIQLRYERFDYDERGKLMLVSGFPGTHTSRYSPMGALAYSDMRVPENTQTLTVDALGNMAFQHTVSDNEDGEGSDDFKEFRYTHNGTNRQTRTETWDSRGQWRKMLSWDATEYDPAGNRTRHSMRSLVRTEPMSGNELEEVAIALDDKTLSYYDAEGRLRATDRRRCIARLPNDDTEVAFACVGWENAPGRDPGVFEEYRYDALGRRIAVRSRPDKSQCSTVNPHPCIDRLVRTVWDGDQLLLELRANDGGLDSTDEWVAYTQGPGIDAPLMVRANVGGDTRYDVIPLPTWRGLYEAGVFPDGRVVVEGMDLRKVRWPGTSYGPFFEYFGDPNEAEPVWLGSLMSHKRDASGQLYMRNRYFDPASGRFTQEDPIGLAGGLNLYGFGGGDPVNYTDPYGLSADTIPEQLQEKVGEDLCGNRLGAVPNCDDATIVTSGSFHGFVMQISGGRTVTLGTNIYTPRALDPNSKADVALLAHELVHVGEYQMLAADGRAHQYYQHGIMARIVEQLGGNPYDWRRVGRPFAEENGNAFEARGQVVQDCFLGVASACAASPYKPPTSN